MQAKRTAWETDAQIAKRRRLADGALRQRSLLKSAGCSAVQIPCVGTPPILHGKEVRNMEIQIAVIQLASAVPVLVTEVLALLPALGKAIRRFIRKRPKR